VAGEKQVTLPEPTPSETEKEYLSTAYRFKYMNSSVAKCGRHIMDPVSRINCIHIKFRPISKKTTQRNILHFKDL
jgi:hypothetical protein